MQAPHSLSSLSAEAALPADVTLHLFSYIAARPRLFVLSLVCRRWRTLALRSISHLPIRFDMARNPAKMLSLFPALRDLDLQYLHASRSAEDIVVPSTLHRLVIFIGKQPPLHPLPVLSKLVVIGNYELGIERGNCPILQETSSRLIALTLKPSRSDGPNVQIFPNLTKLALPAAEVYTHFISAHQLQLRRLSLLYLDLPSSIELPFLTSFSVKDWVYAEDLIPLIVRFTALTHLTVELSFRMVGSDVMSALHVLANTSRITSLDISMWLGYDFGETPHSVMKYLATSPLATRIVSLLLSSAPPLGDMLLSFSNLRSLSFNRDNLLTVWLGSGAPRSLTSLSTEMQSPLSLLLSYPLSLLAGLRRLKFICDVPLREVHTELCEFLY